MLNPLTAVESLNSSLLTDSEENYTLTLLLPRSVTGIDVNCKAKRVEVQ